MAGTIEILVGAARCGKTPALLDEYRAALRRAQEQHACGTTLWLTPTTRARADILARLPDETLLVCFAPNVYTFERFAEAILKWCPQDVMPISDVARGALLRILIDELHRADKLPYFAPIAETAGFLRLVSDFISELKRDEIWPDDFAKACRRRGETPKDGELLSIYEEYQQQLVGMNLYDSEGRFWSARTELEKGELGPFRNLSLVVVDGFTDFTQTQYEILGKLAEVSKRMLVSLPLESPLVRPELFAKSNAARDRLGTISKKAKAVSVNAERASRDDDLPAFEHVSNQLFANPRNVTKATDGRGIEIVATTGQLGEVEAVAERVKRLLLAGTRPDDIAVAFRPLDEYADLVVEVFTDCGIPHGCDSGIPLARMPIIKALCGLLRLEAEGWPFERLTAVLGSSSFRPNWKEFEVDAARLALASTLRETQVHADRDTMLRVVEREARRLAATDSPPAKSRLGADDFRLALDLLQRLSTALEPLRRKLTLAEWSEALQKISRELGLLKSLSVTMPAPEPTEGRQFDREAWQLLLGSLSSVAGVETLVGRKPRKLALDEFQHLLDELVLSQPIPRGIDERGRVRVVDAEQVRGLDVPYLFLAGLSEGSFPRLRNDDCLYNEAERRKLNDSGLTLGHRSSRSEDEMLLYYGVVTRATKSLTLSYPSISAAGQPLFPSPYLSALRDLFEPDALPVTRIEELDPVPSVDRIQSTADLRLVATSELAHDRPALFASMAAKTEYNPVARNVLAAVDMASKRFHQQGFTSFEGMLEIASHARQLQARYPADSQFSATQLEAYAACPFRFFLSEVLHIAPLESPRAETDYLRRGQLLHGVLSRLHEELADAEQSKEGEPSIATRFRELVTDQLGRRVPPTELQRVLASIEERLLHDWAAAYEEQASAYLKEFGGYWNEAPRPFRFEVAFGNAPHDEGAEPRAEANESLTIGRGKRQVRVRGRIDRIDVGQIEGRPVFNIIDYKSGSPPRFSLDDVRAGLSLQLALYTLAVARMNLAGDGAVPFQMGYWSIREKGFVPGLKGKAKPLDEAVLKSLEQLLEEVLPSLVHGMRSGQFPVDSLQEDCTGRCPYNTVCRVNQIRPLADKLHKHRRMD